MKIQSNIVPGALTLVTLLSTASMAFADTNYLLITATKMTSLSGSPSSTQTTDYKILLDPSFFAQFKNQPNPNSAGTEFYCAIGDMKPGSYSAGIQFTEWFAPRPGGKVATWFWGAGAEEVRDRLIDAENPKAGVNVTFPSWLTMDAAEQLSFENSDAENFNSMNIGFQTRSVAAADPALSQALLAPVKTSAGLDLVAGDSQAGVSLFVSCSFQEN